MFSAWRKLKKKQDDKPVFPTGVAPVDQTMQKKFAKGVQYNMKIIIKGDRNTGKSTLLLRLTGGKFKEEYIPTHEIQIANVNWNYRGASDIVKVEVWDIVDKSRKKRTQSDSLKISNEEEDDKQLESNLVDGIALDAEFINVYKGTHGVILMVDITKAWTWKYAQRELEKIPHHIPVLILANFRDMGDNRVVQVDEITAYVDHLDRPTGSAEVYYAEASMKDGFGLIFIYTFLNMPFLLLQRETLLRQLEANALEIEDTRESLVVSTLSEDQNYGLFKEMLYKKVNPSLSSNNSVQASPAEDRKIEEPVPPVSIVEPPPPAKLVATVPPTVHTTETPKTSRFQNYKAKLFGSDSSPKKEEPITITPDADNIVPIDEFNPGQLDDKFLTASTLKPTKKARNNNCDSDDEDDDKNPMVAAYEDLSSEDEKMFDEQLSADDFDDLSDDERPKMLKENEMSIVEQVKASKRRDREILNNAKENFTDDVVSTDILDVDVDTVEYDDLDGDFNNVKVSIDNELVIDNTLKNFSEKQQVKRNAINSVVEESDEEKDDDERVFVISTDVDDEWMDNNDCSNNDTDEEEETEVEVHIAMATKDIQEPAVSQGTQQASTNFDLDDLEMFMTNQLKKTSITAVDTQVDVIPEITKPKKKKKKKKVTEGSETTSTEKRKKKKPKDDSIHKDKDDSIHNDKDDSIHNDKDDSIHNDKGTTPKRSKKTKSKDQNTSVEKKSKKSSRTIQSSKSELDTFYDEF